MGPRFDDDVKKIGLNALIHGISFPFWNLDHIDVFAATEFAPIWDETSGALMAGIRFWRLDATRAAARGPLRAGRLHGLRCKDWRRFAGVPRGQAPV